MFIARIAYAQSQIGDFAPAPLAISQDGDTTAIENYIKTKTGWWSSLRFAFGSDDFYPSPWTPDYRLLPLRLRVKNSLFSREITMGVGVTNMILSEHPSDSSRGLGGFPCNEVYFGAGNLILQVQPDDVHAQPFKKFAVLDGIVRSLLFDTVGTFGYGMLVTTENGSLFRINSLGKPTRLANVEDDIKAADILPLDTEFGPLSGQLITVSRFLGRVRSINNSGVVTRLDAEREFPGAQALFVVPRPASDATPEKGAYLLHWYRNLEHPYTEQELSFAGDLLLIVQGRHRELWRLHWNGSRFGATPLTDLSHKIDEITLLIPAQLPRGGTCPARPRQSVE